MSSEEEPELPVTAKVTAVGSMPDEGAAIQNSEQITEGDKLVKRQDAEEAIKEARQQERQKVLDKIKGKLQKNEEIKDRLLPIADNAVHGELRATENTLEELRDDLKEEVEKA